MRILVFGLGKVGTALSRALADVDTVELWISNRDHLKAQTLAGEIDATSIHRKDISQNKYDLVIISILDDLISEVSSSISEALPGTPICHTAGSLSLDVIKGANKRGLFYPLDSFGYAYDDELQDTPLLVDANDSELLEMLYELAEEISNEVQHLSFDKRAYLHLSAVLINNFTNALARKAFDILDQENIDPSLLNKLIQTTYQKIIEHGPVHSQTGPAVRQDDVTISKHLSLLNNQDDKALYAQLSSLIISQKNQD